MTKLDAVNEMLESIGEPPVTALDTGGTSDQGDAERILDRETDSVLLLGWACNTIRDQAFSPSGGKIALTLGSLAVLRFTPAAGQYGSFAQRGAYLYDTLNNTDTFTASVRLDVILRLDFEDLSDALAKLIVKAASVKYQRYKKRGTIDDSMNREELIAARGAAERENAELLRTNVLTTESARRLRGWRSTDGEDQ